MLGNALPLQITLGAQPVTTDLDPYITFLDRSFETLAPREPKETPQAYIERHLLHYGKQWTWNATVTVFDRRTLEADEPRCGYRIKPTPEPVQVVGVMDDGGTYFDISESVGTLEYWCPRLAGSLITTLQRASHLLQIWGPVEAVENPMAFMDEGDYWDNMRYEALEHYTSLQKEAHAAAAAEAQAAGLPAPAEPTPVTTVTREQFKAFLREQDFRTPGRLKRAVGQATYNSAKYPLTREQLDALVADPVTSAVQAEALQEFLSRCDEIRQLHDELMALSDEEAYAQIQPEDDYFPYQFSLETEPRRDYDLDGTVYEMLREYMEYQMNSGSEPRYFYAAQTTLGPELPAMMNKLQQLFDLFTAQCRLLTGWPETGVTPEMRQAHGRLKPPKCRAR
ncbi:hypothetical protein [Deinococcus ficus]|uniref:Uncharacterized protein n=1 Tax=Deinococcus ficus TaxID=317577 RepID=A0A221T2W1_9DEIO|nr:hypothetical protein [Deinococcus ficus]ASN83233.1 hypothetical protein DFI_18725 [Deinococcus ficus]